jgi:regulator of cell morphogenesis and NO signaling
MKSVTTTLADLATANPAASRVFHRHGLDFCCGGRRPLADACRERGLEAAAVLEEIDRETPAESDVPGWDTRPIPDLVAFIVSRYHDGLRAELPQLIALADKVERKHADKSSCPRGLADHLRAVDESVRMHLAKEENVLFPMLANGMGRMAAGPIRVMEMEHDDHRENLMRTRALTADLNPPEEACTSWRALYLRLDALEGDLMEHIHLENNVLFPRALETSTNDDSASDRR